MSPPGSVATSSGPFGWSCADTDRVSMVGMRFGSGSSAPQLATSGSAPLGRILGQAAQGCRRLAGKLGFFGTTRDLTWSFAVPGEGDGARMAMYSKVRFGGR